MAKISPISDNDLEKTISELTEAQFVHKFIPYRRCKQMVQHTDAKKPDYCQCGHHKDAHYQEAVRQIEPSETKWSVDLHTESVYQANSFGTIEFTTTQKTAKYVRVDAKMIEGDNMRHITDLMLNYWDLAVPNLIITVTGGALSFNLSRLLSEKFRQGIVRAAQSTGAWIVTGGTHAGVMKHTGKAVRDCAIQGTDLSDVVCIGVVPWGVVENRDCLTGEVSVGKYPARYTVPKIPKDPKHPDARRIYLDPNHTHFVMVDDGTHGKFATEIKLRAALEERVSKMSPSVDKSVKVPVCCVVLQGGPGSLTTVYEAVRHGTPVVIVKDSGKMADILAAGYLNSTEEEEILETDANGKPTKRRMVTKMDDAVRESLRVLLRAETNDAVKVEDWLRMIEDCLRIRDLVTIFRLDATDVTTDLDLAILLSLFKAKREEVVLQLKLSLAWNRVDVADQYLFSSNRRWPRGFFNDVAHSAFVNDRVDFMKLFLKNGLHLKEYLGIYQLSKLYNEVPKKSLLYGMLTNSDGSGVQRDIDFNEHKQALSLYHIGRLLDSIFGDLMGHPYCDDDRYNWVDTCRLMDFAEGGEHVAHHRESKVTRSISRVSLGSAGTSDYSESVNSGVRMIEMRILHEFVHLSRRCLTHEEERLMYAEVIDLERKRHMTARTKDAPNGKTVSHFDDPAFDLFLYCVLLRRHDMAMVCFGELREAIPAAITATLIYTVMASLIDDSELQAEYEQEASFFENLAINVLNECFEANPSTAQQLLIRKVPLLNGRTCLGIARAAHAIQFISHPCCQTLFNRLWFGNIVADNTPKSMAYISLACFIPPLIYAFDYDSSYAEATKSVEEDGSIEEKEKASYGRLTTKRRRAKYDSCLQSTCFQPIGYFYNAPIVIFFHTIMSYICFLIVMSYDILILYPSFGIGWNTNAAEIVLVIYVMTLFCEQIRKAFTSGKSKLFSLYLYLQNPWNILELIAIVLFVLAMVLGNINDQPSQTSNAGRIFYAFAICLFFAKILRWYAIDQTLGPKVVIIGRMLRDMMTFMFILLVAVVAWGIVEYALLFPKAPQQWTLIRDVLVLPYLQIFGQFYFNVIQQQPFDVPSSDSCTNDPELYSNYTMIRCADSTGQIAVPIMLAVYVMFCNLLLLNLLTAAFATTFSSVQEETDQHWNYQRFELIAEFNAKPPLVPPFIFFSHAFQLIRAVYCWLFRVKPRQYSFNISFKVRYDEKEDEAKSDWMCGLKDDCLRKSMQQEQEGTDVQIIEMKEKMVEAYEQLKDLAIVPLDKAVKIWPRISELKKHAIVPDENAIRDVLVTEQEMISPHQCAIGDDLIEIAQNADTALKLIQDVLKAVEQSAHPALVVQTGSPTHVHRHASSHLQGAIGDDSHKNARLSSYPVLQAKRFPVPDNKVSWQFSFKSYKPVVCAAPEKLLQERYSAFDPDLLSLLPEIRTMKFNQFDLFTKCNRVASEFYCVKDGIPRNPAGRTGMIGRGLLPRWGPNYALMCALLRQKRHYDSASGKSTPVEVRGQPVLQVLVYRDSSMQQTTLPYSLFESLNTSVFTDLLKIVTGSINANASLNAEKRAEFLNHAQRFIHTHEKTVYTGYFDNALNTDNAWLEAQCVGVLLPDDLGHALSDLKGEFFWSDVSAVCALAANYNFRHILKKVAENYAASF